MRAHPGNRGWKLQGSSGALRKRKEVLGLGPQAVAVHSPPVIGSQTQAKLQTCPATTQRGQGGAGPRSQLTSRNGWKGSPPTAAPAAAPPPRPTRLTAPTGSPAARPGPTPPLQTGPT